MDFEVHPFALDLGELFERNGYELALVGGSVRDMFLKRESYDLDFTTNALPDQTHKLMNEFCEDVWDVGKKFGTIGGLATDLLSGQKVQIEITTYRTDEYDPSSRKPLVKYGDRIEQDLSRRDFTINSIALRVPSLELVDPFNGISDLAAQILRTPIEPQKSFDDDPLRMMRAVRFVSSLSHQAADGSGFSVFKIEAETAAAILEMKERLEIVSAERVRDEFSKLMLSVNPRAGIEALMDSGLVEFVLPELADLQMSIDPGHHHKDVFEHSLKVLENAIRFEQTELSDLTGGDIPNEPNLVLRLAALLHDIGKPATRKFSKSGKVSFLMHDIVGAKITRRRLRELKYPNDVVKNVSRLVELHMRFYGYGEQGWTDSAVRRYVNDAGELLPYLHIISRSDVTTQNNRKANYISEAYKDMMTRIDELKAKEEFEKIRPDLDGFEIMELLGIDQNDRRQRWKIGKAYKFLLQWRIDEGPHEKAEAEAKLLEFAKTL